MVTVTRKVTPEVEVAGASRGLQQIDTPDAAFGAAGARALQQGADVMAQQAVAADRIAQELAKREDETRLLEYETQLENFETETLYTGDNAVLNRKGSGAFGSTKTSLEGFDKHIENLDKTLTSERQRHLAKRLKTRARTSMARSVSRHEATQRRVWENAARAAAIESAQDTAILNYSDPEKRKMAMTKIEGLVRAQNAGMPAEAIAQRVEAEKTQIHAKIIDRYAENSGLAEAEAYYKEFKDEMDPDAHIAVEKSFNTMRKQQQRIVQNEITQQMGVIEDTMALGIKVPDSEINAMINLAKKNGLDKQAEALGQVQQIFADNQEFLDTPLPQQPQVLAEARRALEDNPTREELTRYKMLQKSFDKKIKQLQQDPIAYYEQRKEVRPYKPVDISNPEALRYEIEQRRVAVRDVQAKDGINIPLLRKAEIDAFAAAYAGANAEEKTALLYNMRGAFQGDEARALAKKIAPKQKSMAAVMAIVHDAPEVASKIASGATREKFVSSRDVKAEIQNQLEGAVQDGVALEAISESVHDLYTELSFEANDTSNVLDPDRLREAKEQVVGPKLKIKTGILDATPSHILPFRKEDGQFISEGQFKAALKTVDLETLLETHGDTFKTPEGINLDVQEVIGRTKLITVGDGVYELHTRTGQQVMGSTPGQPFRLDMKKIANSENTRGLFQKAMDNINRTSLDRYVEANERLETLRADGADEAEITAAEEELDKLKAASRRSAIRRQAEENMVSRKEGF